jgi:hypothetical protein
MEGHYELHGLEIRAETHAGCSSIPPLPGVVYPSKEQNTSTISGQQLAYGLQNIGGNKWALILKLANIPKKLSSSEY